MMSKEKILVIRHGALGDFMQSLGPFAAIRAHHPEAPITLLTSPFLVSFAKEMPYFDDVWADTRPRWTEVHTFLSLLFKIKRAGFTHIYDLQTSKRTAFYFHLLSILMGNALPAWSGHVPKCRFPHVDKNRTKLHTLDRQRAQLRRAGIEEVPPPSFAWWAPRTIPLLPSQPFALIVAQASLHRPDKCWPLSYYSEIISRLARHQITSVLIGSAQDQVVLPLSAEAQKWVVDWRGKTALTDLIHLGRNAHLAIGNDTGPMHMFAIAGCPSWVLFSSASNPELCAPRGENVTIMQRPSFDALTPDILWDSIAVQLDRHGSLQES